MFHVNLEISVEDSDRELEIIQVKKDVETIVDIMSKHNATVCNFNMSCEHMAEFIISRAKALYGEGRYYKCSVLEDGENGAIVCTE